MRGEMVRAILDGRKTQTRRIVKPQPSVIHAIHADASLTTNCIFRNGDQRIHCPHGQPGDRLWVKETWVKTDGMTSVPDVFYRASENAVNAEQLSPWKPSIFMPRWASRITLEIVGVRVERVQDITETDAMAEGVAWKDHAGLARFTAAKLYAALWDSINAKTHPWASNPWVWVIEFKRV